MALAIDASTPAARFQTVSGTAAATTVSFTPPAGSVIVLCCMGNDDTTVPTAPTITDSLGTHLTYTLVGFARKGTAGSTSDGWAAIFTAPVVTSAAMTITSTSSAISGFREQLVAPIVITGQGATPVGTHSVGSTVTLTTFTQSVLATVAGSLAIAAWLDWDAATTTITAGTGCTVQASGSASGLINAVVVRRTANDGVAGSSKTLALSAPSSNAQNWVYVEIVPPAAAGPPVGDFLPFF